MDRLIEKATPLASRLRAVVERLERRVPHASCSLWLSRGWTYHRDGDEASSSEPEGRTGLLVRADTGVGLVEATTDDLAPDGAQRLADQVLAACSTIRGRPGAGPDEPLEREFAWPSVVDPTTVLAADKIHALDEAARHCRSFDARVVNTEVEYQEDEVWHLHVSRNRRLLQRLPFTSAWVRVFVADGPRSRKQRHGARRPGGFERVAQALDPADLERMVRQTGDMLSARPVEPGEHDVVVTPAVSGIIAHEAFGHGVEADMVARGCSRARDFLGRRVGSDLVTLEDTPLAGETPGFYYFDDEGELARRALVIDRGILRGLISDRVSARRLRLAAGGNGRRVAFRRPVYTRMTTTFFAAGATPPAEILASVDKGLLLAGGSSGQEDPLGWGMQVNVPLGYEIRAGKLTGRVFGPLTLTGYVPDLLRSISQVGTDIEYRGLGLCGKTWQKDWLPVGMGGPTVRMRARLA